MCIRDRFHDLCGLCAFKIAGRGRNEHRLVPVSYTHLDVYKRQGERARVAALLTEGGMRRRMQDIGLIEGTEVALSLIHI